MSYNCLSITRVAQVVEVGLQVVIHLEVVLGYVEGCRVVVILTYSTRKVN